MGMFFNAATESWSVLNRSSPLCQQLFALFTSADVCYVTEEEMRQHNRMVPIDILTMRYAIIQVAHNSEVLSCVCGFICLSKIPLRPRTPTPSRPPIPSLPSPQEKPTALNATF